MAFEVTQFWGCIPTPERYAVRIMGLNSVLGVAASPAAFIDAIFTAFGGGWGSQRVVWWRNQWLVTRIEPPSEYSETAAWYVATDGWVGSVKACGLAGACPTNPAQCEEVRGFGHPG